MIYSTYLGGFFEDHITDIAVDSSGNAYVTGSTFSGDFPTTEDAFQDNQLLEDAFVTKLNPDGSSLVYSTYLGGSASESGTGIRVSSGGEVFVTGSTSSDNFPVLRFLQLDPDAQDIFVTHLNSTGSGLVYSTYLGGSSYDSASGIAIDSEGNAYVTGMSNSTDFPTQSLYPTIPSYQSTNNGAGDGIVVKIGKKGYDHLPVITPEEEASTPSGGEEEGSPTPEGSKKDGDKKKVKKVTGKKEIATETSSSSWIRRLLERIGFFRVTPSPKPIPTPDPARKR